MTLRIPVLAACLLLATALHAADKVQSFQVRGVIRELRPDKMEIVIKHETIPGYMDAMTMPFTVRDAKNFKELALGDTVSFKFSVTEKEDWLEDIKVIARARTLVVGPKPLPEVKPGSVLDFKNIKLVDQDGRPFDLAETRGRAVALTFFFTRCPFPTMCPLLASKFAEAQKLLPAEDLKGAPLISISIDPQNDRPEVLKRYAQTHHADTTRWCFATGELGGITRLALLCGVNFWDEKGLVNHSLRTLVISPDGRVKRVFSDNAWSAGDLIQELRQ